jgi:serine protease
MILLSLLVLAVSCSSNLENSKLDTGPGDYIVVFKKDPVSEKAIASKSISAKAVVAAKASAVSLKYNAKVKKTFSRVIQAAVVHLDTEQYQKIISDPQVAFVEKDQIISINASQSDPVWGLDRIDQVERSGDDVYQYPDSAGEGVNAYVIDTGIRVSHEEFEGRAVHGYDAVDDDSDASDCNGHGTHVAGSIGGKKYGVAKKVKLHGVRVLDCRGSGSISGVIAGVEWVTNNHVKPAVANMSLGGGVSQALDQAVRESINSGITYVIAAGNSDRDACSSSPARVGEAITVGASNDRDRRASFSNHGTCVDIFAPGEDIKSAWHRSDSSTDTIDGTSMASPHVAGAVALYLSANPTASVESVVSAVISNSVESVLSDIESGSPNRLLNISFLNESDDGGDDGSGDDGSSDPHDSVLDSGESVDNISAARHEKIYFSVPVPKNAKNLKIQISGGSGDADLYVKKSSVPTESEYDCRPYKSGNDENCQVEEPSEDVYHVMLRAYREYQGVKIQVSYEVVEEEPEVIVAPCTNCDEYDAVIGSRGEVQYHPNGTYYYQSRSKTHKVWAKSADGVKLEVEIYKWQSSRWVRKKSSGSASADAYVSYRGSRGYYLVKVTGVSGNGSYKLWHIGK